jgi:hypothetical protein
VSIRRWTRPVRPAVVMWRVRELLRFFIIIISSMLITLSWWSSFLIKYFHHLFLLLLLLHFPFVSRWIFLGKKVRRKSRPQNMCHLFNFRRYKKLYYVCLKNVKCHMASSQSQTIYAGCKNKNSFFFCFVYWNSRKLGRLVVVWFRLPWADSLLYFVFHDYVCLLSTCVPLKLHHTSHRPKEFPKKQKKTK